jgi:hypothetical protein
MQTPINARTVHAVCTVGFACDDVITQTASAALFADENSRNLGRQKEASTVGRTVSGDRDRVYKRAIGTL